MISTNRRKALWSIKYLAVSHITACYYCYHYCRYYCYTYFLAAVSWDMFLIAST